MRALNSIVERIVVAFLAMAFAGLIGVVGLQVLARNLLQVPMIWTPDLSQLLFSWCIFVGAAIAWRQRRHYRVDLWPSAGLAATIPRYFGIAAAAVVICVLLVHGIDMSRRAMTRINPSLGISELWFFVPVPVSGALMALFLVERLTGYSGKGNRG